MSIVSDWISLGGIIVFYTICVTIYVYVNI